METRTRVDYRYQVNNLGDRQTEQERERERGETADSCKIQHLKDVNATID